MSRQGSHERLYPCTYKALYLWHKPHLNILLRLSPAQGRKHRTLVGHERVDSRFLVLAGSESILTEITEYIYFSLVQTPVEFKYKTD